MKKNYQRYLIWILCFIASSSVNAQLSSFKTPPDGGNKKAWLGERIGVTDVVIEYNRPAVKGREGKIYGTSIVHKGFIDISQYYGTSKAAPWRAGANENTTIEFSTDVKVEGKELAAGKYGFFIAYGAEECIVIFSKNHDSWGSYFYDEKEDALRVKVKPQTLDKSVERLRFEFLNQTDNSATIALEWEKLAIPFKVEVDYVKTQLAIFRSGLRNEAGFNGKAWEEASAFCVANNVNYEEGLLWANTAMGFGKNFQNMSTKASLLSKMNRVKESDSLMKAALELGSMIEIHQYGKQLLAEKRNKEALDVFKMNAKKNPNQFVTYAGLARALSANGDYKSALANAKKALPLAPGPPSKAAIEDMIKKLEAGKGID